MQNFLLVSVCPSHLFFIHFIIALPTYSIQISIFVYLLPNQSIHFGLPPLFRYYIACYKHLSFHLFLLTYLLTLEFPALLSLHCLFQISLFVYPLPNQSIHFGFPHSFVITMPATNISLYKYFFLSYLRTFEFPAVSS